MVRVYLFNIFIFFTFTLKPIAYGASCKPIESLFDTSITELVKDAYQEARPLRCHENVYDFLVQNKDSAALREYRVLIVLKKGYEDQFPTPTALHTFSPIRHRYGEESPSWRFHVVIRHKDQIIDFDYKLARPLSLKEFQENFRSSDKSDLIVYEVEAIDYVGSRYMLFQNFHQGLLDAKRNSQRFHFNSYF